MASHSTPRIVSFNADGSIAKGKAVKAGSAEGQIAVCSANTDRAVGIIQEEVLGSGSVAEIALQGGGAKALLGEAVSFGNDLVPHTDGSLVKPNASGDQIIARAMEDGDSGDLISVEVYMAPAQASQ